MQISTKSIQCREETCVGISIDKKYRGAWNVYYRSHIHYWQKQAETLPKMSTESIKIE